MKPRQGERALCADWKQTLAHMHPSLRLRRNHPYRGRADGLTTALRKRFAQTRYMGVELEVNQAWLAGPAAKRYAITRAIIQSLDAVLATRASAHDGDGAVRVADDAVADAAEQ